MTLLHPNSHTKTYNAFRPKHTYTHTHAHTHTIYIFFQNYVKQVAGVIVRICPWQKAAGRDPWITRK